MSPSKKTSGGGAVPRPAPLKVHRDSHLIHKAGSSSSSSSASSSSPSDSDVSNGNSNAPPQPQQQRQPVIIYTHSPKIIHTQARDFMALVQKLTGMSRSEDDEGGLAPPQPAQEPAGRSRSDSKAAPRAAAPATAPSFTRNDHNSSFSPENSGVLTGDVHGGQQLLLPPALSPGVFDPPPPNPFLSDIPLFTSDLFCSPRHYYNYSTTVFPPPNVGSSISHPSVLDAMKALHEY